jgi:hypothetical protein
MRLNAVPENLFERIALRAGVVPTPLGDTIIAMTLARTIMVPTKLGIFEVLAKRDPGSTPRSGCGRIAHERLRAHRRGQRCRRSAGACVGEPGEEAQVNNITVLTGHG